MTPSDLARTLVERKRQELERYARQGAELRSKLELWAAAARGGGELQRAWLIGSLAWGNFGPDSDVDVVVEGLSPDLHTETWSALGRLLNVRVDLLRLEELPADFAERVRAEGRPL